MNFMISIDTSKRKENHMETDSFQSFIRQRWSESIEKWEPRLGRVDYRDALELGKFASQDSQLTRIADEIESRDGFASLPWLQHFSMHLRPIVQILKPFSMWLIMALHCAPEEIAIFWGVFHLLVLCSSSSKATSDKFIEFQTDLRKTMSQAIRFAECLPYKNDEKEAILDISIGIMDFWISCIKVFRAKKPALDAAASLRSARRTDLVDPWRELNDDFNKSKSEIDFVLMTLRTLVEVSIHRSAALDDAPSAFITTTIGEQAQFPILLLPIPDNPDFFGRTDILGRMNRHLNPSSRKAGFRCYTVYGAGGVGKTQIALKYAYNHHDSYDAIFWVDSETSVSTRQSFLDIALILQLPGVDQRDNAEQVRMAVDTWLRITERHWLIIFDNVESWDTILAYWPRHPGSAIITSRDYRLANKPASDGERVDPFNDNESFDLFKTSITSWNKDDQDELEAAKKLLELLDGHPLAIDQIVGLINSYGMSVQDFLSLYNQESTTLHAEREVDVFYPKSLDMVWRATFDNLSKTPSTLHFLGVLSLLSPSSIPDELFEPRSEVQLPAHLSFCKTQIILLKEVQKLRCSALISKSRKSLQIHRLTQTLFLQHASEITLVQIFDSASILLSEAFPKQHKGDPMYEKWTACQTYIQHGQSLAQRYLELRSYGAVIRPTLSFIELLSNCAWFLHETDEVDSCSKLLEAAFLACEFCEADEAELDIVKSHLLNTSGLIAWQALDYQRSEEAMQEAAKIRKKRLHPDDDRIAGCLNNLGNLWAAQGHFDKALDIYLDSEAKIRLSADPTCIDLCRASLNLSRLYRAMRNQEKAREKLAEVDEYLKHEDMRKMPLWIAAAEFIHGDLYKDLGEPMLAKAKYEEALRLREQHQPGDATVAATMYKISGLLVKLGEVREAKDMLEKALSIAMNRKARGHMGRVLEQLAALAAMANDESSLHDYRARATAIQHGMAALYGQVTRDEGSFFDQHVTFFDR